HQERDRSNRQTLPPRIAREGQQPDGKQQKDDHEFVQGAQHALVSVHPTGRPSPEDSCAYHRQEQDKPWKPEAQEAASWAWFGHVTDSHALPPEEDSFPGRPPFYTNK